MSDEFRGMRVTVMGLGRFGGGVGVAGWLADNGAQVVATDLLSEPELGSSLRALDDHVRRGSTTLRLGGHEASDYTGCDLVVVNPAVPAPWANPYLAAATAAGIPLTTEIRLLVERLDRRRVIGVTGTAGKSTTAAMIHHVFRRLGKTTHLGGNIGGTLLSKLERIEADDWIVLELSSAMLYWLGDGAPGAGAGGWSPHVAVMTNLRPNHVDWHGTVEHYARCKRGIFEHQAPDDHALRGETLDEGPPLRLPIPGGHNRANARLAIAAVAAAAGLDRFRAAETLGDFPGLPHRLQLLAEHGELRFYDDSKATTPEATTLAVEAFEDGSTVHLVAGGYDKRIDLSAIVELTPRVAGLYTIGATGQRLAEQATGEGHAEYCQTLPQAAARALDRMSAGDVLLLSPGCASWDQFDNYEQRGAAFAKWVREHVVGERS
jgi:UDP-N-acetylmuramoylalanine--D-glutamate ligase